MPDAAPTSTWTTSSRTRSATRFSEALNETLRFATLALLPLLTVNAAFAHAFLNGAEPRVGSTVSSAPRRSVCRSRSPSRPRYPASRFGGLKGRSNWEKRRRPADDRATLYARVAARWRRAPIMYSGKWFPSTRTKPRVTSPSSTGLEIAFPTMLILARIIHFAAALTLFGAAFYPLYGSEARGAACRRLYPCSSPRRSSPGSCGSGARSQASADTAPLLPIIAHTEFGRVWCFRLALNLLLIAAITLMPAAGSRLRQTLLCLFSAALLVSLAWLGHSATSQGVTGAERLITMAIHLLCAGGWLGGL